MTNKRRVLVTGASKGIGQAIAARLAAEGFFIIVHFNSDKAGAEKTLTDVRSAGSDGALLQFDIANREQTRAAIETDIAEQGAYYGVIANAGVIRDNAFPAISGEDWDAVLHTNLDGFYNVLHPCVMPMVRAKQGGRIVTIASVSGLVGNRGQVNYSAAKAGIMGATKALALELAKRSITVNCVAPGLIDTGMVEPEVLEEALKIIPLRRMGHVDEVAGLVAYLCSDNASYMTRQVISVNGGMF
jgi:3-oxoacyl-[acyl-carrier protein] reductase